MGIKDLFAIIKDAHVPARKLSFETYRGKRIGIDAAIWLNRFGKSSKTDWVNGFLLGLCALRKYDIRPVFIYDGEESLPFKDNERAARRETINRQKTRLERLKFYEANFDQLGDKNEIIALFTPAQRKQHANQPLSEYDIRSFMLDRIDKLELSTIDIGPEYVEISKRLLEIIGIPYIQATGEAEPCAARLCGIDYIDAVMTEDSDAFAHGCSTVLCFKDNKIISETFIEYRLDDILKTLDMSFARFQDLCILLSCDYNQRVKGYPPDGKKYKKPASIGKVGALCIMQHVHTLEDAAAFGYLENIEDLQIDTCRQLFSADMHGTLPDINPRPCQFDQLWAFMETHVEYLNQHYIQSCLSM